LVGSSGKCRCNECCEYQKNVSEHCPRESHYEKKDRTVEGATVSGGKGEEWERGGQKNELSASRKLCGEGGDFNARLRDPENNGGE
jgi:hypothetical protein